MSVLSGIYEKVRKTRAVTIWHEITLRLRDRADHMMNFTQVFSFLMSIKQKELQRLAY